jgi:DNA-binding NtrC family response regulator
MPPTAPGRTPTPAGVAPPKNASALDAPFLPNLTATELLLFFKGDRMDGRVPAFVGESPAITDIRRLIARVAPTEMTVLVTGESGTGKEEVARLIHRHSRRALAPFKAINCGAIPAELAESELFGHERGAFTGASDRRVGKFEEAEGGTLLLDEVGEMPPPVQIKLLRVLEERELQRLGSNRPIRIDVRIVAATNRVLAEEVRAGRFRCDLYYRLQACELGVPPLRERRSDVPALAAHFAARYAEGRRPVQFTEEALRALEGYPWPGNVRELAHAVEFAVHTCPGGVVRRNDLPERIRSCAPEGEGDCDLRAAAGALRMGVAPLSLEGRWRAETQRFKAGRAEAARRKVAECGGNKTRAAKSLGITRQWLYKLLKETQPEA